MKKLPYTILLLLFSLQGFTQINNLTDLLDVSKLTIQEMVSELQYTWEILPPTTDETEKGYITEHYNFAYNKNATKQILRRNYTMILRTDQTIYTTNFIFSDKALLDRIVTNLKYNGYELKGTQGKQSMYEDGNNIIYVDTNFKNVNGVIVYNIGVVIGNKNNVAIPSSKTETKVPKKQDNGQTAQNTKTKKEVLKFCDDLDAWYYIVEIEGENIVFKSYPSKTNTYHKNNDVNEVIKGKIRNGLITIERPKNCEDCGLNYENERFKIKNNILYEVNYEGGYNEYFICENLKQEVIKTNK